MVILDVQLWELGTQRLHQGLSETILVNTLTDVREFNKKERNSSNNTYSRVIKNLMYIYVGGRVARFCKPSKVGGRGTQISLAKIKTSPQ